MRKHKNEQKIAVEQFPILFFDFPFCDALAQSLEFLFIDMEFCGLAAFLFLFTRTHPIYGNKSEQICPAWNDFLIKFFVETYSSSDHLIRAYLPKGHKELRVITSAPIDILPSGQGWKIGRSRWIIENATFNLLTRDYSLTHNYHHDVTAMVGLLAMRSFARFLTLAYYYNATARSGNAPKTLVRWFELVITEDWVRYLDQALTPDIPQG